VCTFEECSPRSEEVKSVVLKINDEDDEGEEEEERRT
jgi:hypothetical protein